MFEHDYKAFPELTNRQLNEFGVLSPHTQLTDDFFARVVRVVDGDTVIIRCDSRKFVFPLRISGINAPELSEGGYKSKAWLKKLIEGENVYVVINPFKRVGKYGRLLGKIFFNGLDVGELSLSLMYSEVFASKESFEVPNIEWWFRNA